MNKRYAVRLFDDERGVCQDILKRLKGRSEKVRRAQILLKADADGPGWPDSMIAEPPSGFREATTRERRTKVDWAIEVAQLLDTHYAACAGVTLVCHNLNAHTKGAF
jgi:hypothetical protein